MTVHLWLPRSPRRFVTMLIALTCVVSAASSTRQAEAVQPLASAFPVTTQGCVRSHITAGPDAAMRGFAQCGTTLRYVVRSGSGWRTVMTLPYSGVLLGSAQDNTGSYLLFADRGTHLVKVGRDAAPGPRRTLSRNDGGDDGAVVARDGRWWAVWSTNVPDGGGRALVEAGTLLGPTPARRITFTNARDMPPALALRPGGGLLLGWPRVTYTDGRASSEIRVATNRGSGWASRSLAVESGIPRVTVVSSGAHTFLSWQRDLRPVVASNESGVLRTKVLTVYPCATGTRLAVSAGRVFVAWNACTSGRLDYETGYTDPKAQHEIYLAERAGGAWSTASVFSGSQFSLGGLTAGGGKATVIADRLGSDPTKFQMFSRSQR